MVHGDDLTFLSWEEDFGEVAEYFRKLHELKVRGGMGGEAGDVEEIIMLNRRLTWRGGFGV